jgi:leucyl-tRNA synthetase
MSKVVSNSYLPKEIEKNWRDNWFNDNIYEAVDFSPKPKKYILAELPYPSGKFLHVGHMMRYTVPEIYSRFLRMQGYNVLYPMGWDCFGLPAETFAIKEGVTPQEAIKIAVKSFKESLKTMGYGIDWSRELSTSDPNFYKWTQWTFKRLFEEGLAVEEEMPVWWCKELGVLADEEVLPDPKGDGKISERGSYPVERKMFKQWVIKLPEYADRLLEDLNKVDYEEYIKHAQRNWIGRKEGINITYKVDGTSDAVTCFTTRPDTNFGATFIVLAPEHEFVSKIVSGDIKVPKDSKASKEEVSKYVSVATGKTDLERQQEGKTKTGAFTGFYAVNNLNGKKIPIYVSDFVLASFGTGAVVGVPGHDKRDFEFAKAFDLPIIRVVVAKDGDKSEITSVDQVQEEEGIMINSDFLDGLDIHKATKKVMDYLVEKGWGEKHVTYKMRNQVFSRQRYWGEPIPLVHTEDGKVESISDSDLPLKLPIMKDFLPDKDGSSPLKKAKEWVKTTGSKGEAAKRETDTMPTWAGSNWYYLRYVDPHNDKELVDKKKAEYWMPVDKYFGDAGHTTVHLLYSRFWYKFLYDQGVVPHDEPYKYRMSGGLLLGPDGQKMSKSRGNVIDPKSVVDSYGADAVRTYLAFIGPYDETYPWNENGLVACYKLLRTIYGLKDKVDKSLSELEKQTKTTIAYNKMVKNMTEMMTDLKMNTSVSEIMIFTNHIKKQDKIAGDVWEGFVKVIAPFAPFLAEELWQEFKEYKSWDKNNSVHLQDWPKFNNKMLVEDNLTIPVQVNGKFRAEINIESDTAKDKEFVLSKAEEAVKEYLEGEPKNKVYVPGKIVNFVV